MQIEFLVRLKDYESKFETKRKEKYFLKKFN